MAPSVSTGPTTSAERLGSIDILRGFALLGILIMNIQGFSMVEAAYFTPTLHMDLTGLNWWVWVASHMFADLKFMAIFSMLFGAGIVLLTQRREAEGRSTWQLHFKRTFWLLAFGLIHAYLIWFGDILVTYALAAIFVFWFRKLSARSLLAIGAVVLCIAPALGLLGGWSLQSAPPAMRAEVIGGFIPNAVAIAAEIEAYRGSWLEALNVRVETTLAMHIEAIPFYLFWRASGLMLIGMALFKLEILSAARTAAFYNRMILFGLLIGLPLVALSVVQNAMANWDPLYALMGPGMLYNYFGSLGMAAAYIGIVMRLVQLGRLGALMARLSAVGRMAFTNYILQSIICTFVFYGFGLGLFGHVDRAGQLAIVVAIWLVQLALSPIWLNRYRFGPLEWLWRSLTYLQMQPMKKQPAQ